MDPKFILCGPAVAVYYLVYRGHYVAEEYLDSSLGMKDKPAFMARAGQYAEQGVIRIRSHGHMLKGKYKDIMQFNFGKSRSWGFRHGGRFYVTNARCKEGKEKAQIPDYELALRIRTEFLEET